MLPLVAASACMINRFSVSRRSSGLDFSPYAFAGVMPAGRCAHDRLSHVRGQIAQRDFRSRGHDHAMLDRRAQFAHVARPIVSEQRVHRVGGQLEQRFLIRLAEMPQKFANEKRNIFLPLAQRRHGDVHDVETEIEIVAKFSLLHQLREVLVRGGDEAHIGAQELVAAHALEGALFADHAQQFHLRARIDLADFVEKNRAAIRLLEAPDAPFVRAGERAAFVAEQFAFEQGRRKRRAMHGDKFRLVPPAQIMNGVRGQFLACAAFPFDQDIRRGGRDLPDGVEHFAQRRRFADDVLEPVTLVHLLPQRAIFLFHPAAGQRARDQHFDFVEIERLRHEIVSAAFHRFDRGVDRTVSRHHDADRADAAV